MTLDRRITGGLAWAGLLVVVGVPSADALTSYLSNRDASVLPAVVAPASQAAPVAAKPVAEVQPATTKPAVVQQVAAAKPQAAPTADPVDRFVASGKKLPSYISDGRGAEVTFCIRVIPDVRGVVLLVGGAAVLVVVLGSPGVDCRRSVSRANMDPSKALLQRLQQLSAQSSPGFYGAVRILRTIGDALDLADFRVKEIPHKKVFG